MRWQDGYERVQTAYKSPNLGGQLFMPEATPRVISRYSVHFEIFGKFSIRCISGDFGLIWDSSPTGLQFISF